MMDNWGYGQDMGYGSNDIWGFVMMLLFFVLLIIGVYFLVKYLAPRSGQGAAGNDAMTILKKRYAAGEIDKNEFDEKKKALAK